MQKGRHMFKKEKKAIIIFVWTNPDELVFDEK